MKDYKSTLNLPKTHFSMKANLTQREPECLNFWKEIDLYAQLRVLAKGRKKYILHDGPPYANGQIHIGHAVNKVLKDIIIKSKTLSGYDAPFVPGWDCHGLPIELNVEKKTKTAPLSPKAFRMACRTYAASQIELQKESFKRLGVLGDWDHPYLTMDFSYEANIIRVLADLMAHGHLQQGQKPVHWCIECQSALAEAEVEYHNKTSKAVDVAFRVVDSEQLNAIFRLDTPLHSQSQVVLPIWTTTPWTLPANEAVAIGEKLDYTLFHTEGGFFILARALSGEIFSRYQIEHYSAIATVPGERLCGLMLAHPFLPIQVPIVKGHHVTLEAGTGAVHIAPAHGVEDYEVGQLNHLPMTQWVDARGCYVETAPFFPGAHVLKVGSDMVALLKECQMLLAVEDLEHSYPHCWRHKTPLIFRATPQWFVSMDKHHLRKDTLKAIQGCEWIPHWGQSRISTMIANRPDWCISRQRLWGTPMPLFIHKETQTPHPNSVRLMRQVADLVEKEGIEAWFELPIQALLGKEEAEEYDKLSDSLDVWFDSGVSHTCVLKQRPELAFPADLYCEGSDQHRGWFHSSILTSVALYKEPPYRTVLTHGYVVDAKGHKMSKSLGNVIDPLDVMKSLGADILRLWIASTDYRGEMHVSQDIIAQSGEIYRRIRNTARFMLSNLWDFTKGHEERPLWEIDRWAIQQAIQCTQELKAAYDTFQFHTVCKKIHHFCQEDLGGFYLDLLKDRLYTLPADSVGRRSAQKALYEWIHALVCWIAPILSFTAEEIWQCLRDMVPEHPTSVFFYLFPSQTIGDKEENSSAKWALLKKVKQEVNQVLEQARNEGKIGASLDATVTLYCDQSGELPLYDFLFRLSQQEKSDINQGLRFILITSEAKVTLADQDAVKGMSTNLPGLRVEVEVNHEPKCSRCWHHQPDVNQDAEFPEVCGRCVENLRA